MVEKCRRFNECYESAELIKTLERTCISINSEIISLLGTWYLVLCQFKWLKTSENIQHEHIYVFRTLKALNFNCKKLTII